MPNLAILLQAESELLPWQQSMADFFFSDGMVTLGTWVAAGLTLFMFSFVYKDNPLFRFGEHLYLGISAGYLMSLYFFNNMKPKFFYPLMPFLDVSGDTTLNLWVLIPGVLGLFIIFRLIPGWGWLSRITFAFYIGGFTGITFPKVLNGLLLPQFYATIDRIPYMVTSLDELVLLINALVLFVGALSVLVYFFFSVEHRGFVGGVSRVGIYTLMIAFGASFGYTIMARVSLLIGRMQFLMFDWIGEEIVGRIATLFPGG
jgi:hypothetical protein